MEPSYSGFCEVHPAVLSREECSVLISRFEARGYQSSALDYPPSYRTNDRQVLDDRALAERLFARLAPHIPEALTDGDGVRWTRVDLNPRLRTCRYRPGQRFSIHRDGVHWRDDRSRSLLTFMIYLNGREAFDGGLTRFFATRDDRSEITRTVPPERGSAIVFDHDLWHDGDTVTAGTKYVLRSEVVYTTDRPVRREHQSYVWSLAELEDGAIASGGRDKKIRIWRRDNRLTEIGALQGHTRSVTALVEPQPGLLMSASRDRTLRLWDTNTLRLLRTVDAHEGTILSLLKRRDGTIVSTSADGAIKLWTGSGAAIDTLRGHNGWVWSVAEQADGTLLTAGEDGTVRSWRHGTGHVMHRHDRPFTAIVVVGDRWVAGDDRGTLHRPGRAPIRVHDGRITAIVSLASNRIATAGEDDTLTVFDLPQAQVVLRRRHQGFVRCLAALADGSLASGAYDDSVRIWPPIQKRAVTVPPVGARLTGVRASPVRRSRPPG